MSVCGGLNLSSDLVASCGAVGGTTKSGYLFNWDDVALAYGSSGEVTGISFVNSCAKGYKFTTREQANQWTVEGSRTNGAPMFAHSVIIRGSVETIAQVAELNNLAKSSRLIAVLENNGNAVNRFVVLGAENGLMPITLSNASGQNPDELNAFELTLSGTDSDIERVLAPTSQTTNALQRTYLEGLSEARVARGITSVDAGTNNWTFLAGDTIRINGCGLLQMTTVSIANRNIPIAGVSGATFSATVTATDDYWDIVIGGTSGTSTNSVTVTPTFIAGAGSAYTNPSPIVINVTA